MEYERYKRKIDPSIIERVLDLAERIQQVPSPTFGEGQRTEFIRNYFYEQGAKDVTVDECGNVYVHIIGRANKLPIIVSAHLDTVFPLSAELTSSRTPEKISGPGIGDNSLGLAGLFGLYWLFKDSGVNMSIMPNLDGDVWLIADVGEEGLGNLRGMKAVVNRFGTNVLAYVVLEGMSLGQIYHRGLGVRRYRISVHTKGGHSWTDYGSPSAIHELAGLIVNIKDLPIPVEPRTSVNVGVVAGGTSVNTIAADASLELDLRSMTPEGLNNLASQVESLVEAAKEKAGNDVNIIAEVIGDRPAGEISAQHPLVKAACKCLVKNGVTPKLNIGSTDANLPLSQGLPAICVGLTTGGGSHTLEEYIDTKPVGLGMKILADTIQQIYQDGISYR